jgi:glutathione synthase
MSRVVAIQMDPVDGIDIDADSTFVLGLEAQRRGYELLYYLPPSLSLRDGRVTARCQPLILRREQGSHFSLGAAQHIDLADVDVVLLRQDPPYDMSYLTTTYLLEHVHPETLVVNDPTEVRNAPEKIFVTHFEDVLPPTLISRDPLEIKSFRDEHKDLIVKPLYGNGGAGVFHIGPGDENLNVVLELFADMFREPVIIQKYLPAVRAGDKRIILVDGVAAGAINRVPAANEARSNMHVGGTAMQSRLTRREEEICEIIGPTLRERGMIFVGIDVIGDYLTEINVTSPTGLQEVNRFDGVCLEAQIWDAIDGRLAASS